MTVLAYDPCWAMLNLDMTLEAHHHPNPEFAIQPLIWVSVALKV